MQQKKSKQGMGLVDASVTPEGFFEFFHLDEEVPRPPSSRRQLVQFEELGISLHYCYALDRLGASSVTKHEREAVNSELQKILGKPGGNDLKLIDSDTFFQGEANCSRLTYGPIDVTIGPLTNGVVIESKAYLIVTLHDVGLVVFTLTTHLGNCELARKLTSDEIQNIEDAYFYDRQIFRIAGKTTSLIEFFKQLRNNVTNALPDMPDARCQKYVSVSIKRTNPEFKNAREYATGHAYEMIAMLGEEADWRQAEKSTVREILAYGLQSKHNDVAVAQEFASVSFDGSPDRAEDFNKFGIFHQQLLDIHSLAASTAFTAMRKLSDLQIEECAKADEKEYQRLIKETNRLLSRYLRVKQCFTNIDHIWTDDAFSQYANGQLELQTTTRKATRKNLDAAMHTLRGLTAQMAAIAQREAESRTGHALQAVSIVLSGTAVLNFVKLVGDAYQLDLLCQLWIGIVSWVAISAIILLIGFRR